MNKYINKDIGIKCSKSYKRAANILEKARKDISGRPDAVFLEKMKKNNYLKRLMR